jgi:putative transposase
LLAPGKLTDKAYIESFNGTLRKECVNTQWFLSLENPQEQLNRWRQEYDVSRHYRALDDQTLTEFAKNHAAKDGIEEVQPADKLALLLA